MNKYSCKNIKESTEENIQIYLYIISRTNIERTNTDFSYAHTYRQKRFNRGKKHTYTMTIRDNKVFLCKKKKTSSSNFLL